MTGPSTEPVPDSTVLNLDDPVCLHENDVSCIAVINFKLLGTANYQLWATATERALTIRNKLGFITGTCARPTDNNKALKWDRANAVVVSWLLSSISDNLSSSHILTKTASELWTELKETYQKVDGSVIYTVFQSINSLTQGSLSVSDYYNALNGLWKEFDSLANLSACTCEASKDLQSFSKQIKLMQFLMGLNESYSQVRSNILMQTPLPSVKAAFSIISSEESHKGNLFTGNNNKASPSAFVAKVPESKKGFIKNTNLICKNCNQRGHTIERCFKIIGFPKDFKFKNKPAANLSTSEHSCSSQPHQASATSPSQLSQEQFSKLLELINEKSNGESGATSSNNNFSVSANMAGMNLFSKKVVRNWVVDSGATQHMTSCDDGMFNLVDVSELNMVVDHPNGSCANISKIGTLNISPSLQLPDVLVVPEFNVDLLSVHKLARYSRVGVYFDESMVYLQDLQVKQIVKTGNQSGGLYFLEKDSVSSSAMNVSMSVCFVSKFTWHSRLGHPAEKALKLLKSSLGYSSDESPPCDICHRAKQTREPFPLSDHKSKSLGELIHLDVWGPYKVSTREGFKYFLTIVDDFTRAVWVYLLKGKDEVFNNIVVFCNMIKNQFSKSVKICRTDNGTEFVNSRVNGFFEKEGILHQTSCVHTPQQNGVVERKHRHLMNVARSLLFQSHLPLNLWGETILTATFLINRVPSSVLNGKTPFEMIFDRLPNFNMLRTFWVLKLLTLIKVYVCLKGSIVWSFSMSMDYYLLNQLTLL